jgi:hypothetical protein
MLRALRVGHLAVGFILTAYCLLMIEQFGAKLLSPESDALRFWRPGMEVAVLFIALFALIGILSSTIGVIRLRKWPITIISGIWLICFTWYGWFSMNAPFRLHELVGVDLNDAREIRSAEMLQQAQAAILYLILVIFMLLPLGEHMMKGSLKRKTQSD